MNMNKAKMINDAVMATAIREAEERGREQGRNQGLEQGREQTKIKLALSMMQDNEPIAKILKYTGLSPEQIEDIRDKLM